MLRGFPFRRQSAANTNHLKIVGVAGLHRRDRMKQTGMLATLLQHLGDDRLLTDMALGDMLNRDPGFRGQRCRRLPLEAARCHDKPG
jgi:hypothetical protein